MLTKDNDIDFTVEKKWLMQPKFYAGLAGGPAVVHYRKIVD